MLTRHNALKKVGRYGKKAHMEASKNRQRLKENVHKVMTLRPKVETLA